MLSRGAKKLFQLRGELETHLQGTFELALILVECSRKLDHVLQARWWREPLTVWTRSNNVRLLRARINEVSIELGTRYKGVMAQLLQIIDPRANFEVEVARAWQYVGEAAITMNHKEFCARLWHGFVPQDKQDKARAIKPKFMLRQFVDEIPACKDQGILIATAYGPMIVPSPSATEILKSLEFAYGLLHVELTKCLLELDVLTDNEISREMISKFCPPYIQYEDWLFNYSKNKSQEQTSYGKR